MRFAVCLLFVACTSTNGEPIADLGNPDLQASARMDVALTTADGLRLTGHLTQPSAPKGGSVVLVHQFMRDAEQWGDLPSDLARNGYRVLAFNLRGHGDSDAYARPLNDLLTDPAGAPRDVDAALQFLVDNGADASRLAILGTSIGANLTVTAAIKNQAKTYVALSARQAPTELLANQAANGMHSIFYLASENDPGGQAADAQIMHDRTMAPRDIYIYEESADHGLAILENHPDAEARILSWLATTL